MSSLLEEAYEPPLASSSNGTIPPSPIPSFQLRQEISGVPTEVLIQTFDDRIVVLVTQNGKIGCLTQASIPPIAQLPHPPRPSPDSPPIQRQRITLPPPPDSINTTQLFGTPPQPTLYSLYTSQIATLIWWTLQETSSPRRPVVVGLALAKAPRTGPGDDGEDEDQVDDMEREKFLGVMEMITGWPGPDDI